MFLRTRLMYVIELNINLVINSRFRYRKVTWRGTSAAADRESLNSLNRANEQYCRAGDFVTRKSRLSRGWSWRNRTYQRCLRPWSRTSSSLLEPEYVFGDCRGILDDIMGASKATRHGRSHISYILHQD